MATSFWENTPINLLCAQQEAQRIRKNIAEMIPISYVWETADDFKEQQKWLWDNVAVNDYQIYGTDPRNYNRRLIYFRHKRDAVLFSLRWS